MHLNNNSNAISYTTKTATPSAMTRTERQERQATKLHKRMRQMECKNLGTCADGRHDRLTSGAGCLQALAKTFTYSNIKAKHGEK